jgi:hypothetical protein
MKEFVPSDAFVKKTMAVIRASEETSARRPSSFLVRVPVALLQDGAFAGGLVVTIAQAVRLYYAVFAPVISQ